MALVLKQTRVCDGSCCKQSPRFPNADKTDCIFHLKPDGKEASGCQLMNGDISLSTITGKSYPSPKIEAKQVFIDTCLDWPQKNSLSEQGNTGNCCWQWVKK